MMESLNVTLAGHAFAPSGRGEDIRCTLRALRSVACKPGGLDLYGLHPGDAVSVKEIGPFLTDRIGPINIFHINGDEVEQATSHLASKQARSQYNIIYPAWELSRYPAIWAEKLDLFDEIWAPTRFIEDSLRPMVTRPIFHAPLASEVMLSSFLGRRYFNIPEQNFVFLFFFDYRSYPERKNPQAIIECFQRLLASRPTGAVSLVIKVSGGEHRPEAYSELVSALAPFRKRAIVLDQRMTDNEIRNLLRCSDCFISLHRAEGFGRGLAEAMYLGKPVIGTGYSGNTEFMNQDNSFLVDYRLIPVESGAYPHWEGQVWADPDLDQATAYMQRLLDDPDLGRRIGYRASVDIRTGFGYRSVGIRYLDRLTRIAQIELEFSAMAPQPEDMATVPNPAPAL